MKLNRNNNQAKELMLNLYNKSWEDRDFLSNLQTNPRNTIESFLNIKLELKNEEKIVVENQTDNDKIYLNIPRKVDLNDFQLTDEELEIVAGGIVGLTVLIAVELVAFGYILADSKAKGYW